ncbi:DUF3164 family protein [Ensifer sesbaniae]|uniref:DUF3164 family protein n=1 Tax=Ensifer sesbaniae TaxID=1214071 RepID=UPI0020008E23|nr:DUF3164 family protein [Ensifer sesbaniae]
MTVAIFEEKPEEGITVMNGQQFMINALGGFDPVGAVKEQYKLEDQTVRKCIAYAREASARIARLKVNTFADLGALDALLAEKFGAKIGGKKGNRTYQSYDGLQKVTVQVSDQITFGAELQIAKNLIDECLNEWSADSRPEIQAIVTRAFNTQKEGQVSRARRPLDRRDRADQCPCRPPHRRPGARSPARRNCGKRSHPRGRTRTSRTGEEECGSA